MPRSRRHGGRAVQSDDPSDDRPRSPSRHDLFESALSSAIIPALPPLAFPPPSAPVGQGQQHFAFAVTIPVLVAIHPKDVSKLKLDLAAEADEVRIKRILQLVVEKIKATGFDARYFEDAPLTPLGRRPPGKVGDELPFADPERWTVSKAVGVGGFGFSEKEPAKFYEKGVRHAAMELTTPMLTRLYKGNARPLSRVELAVVFGHLKRALDVFEPISPYPMAVRCWMRDSSRRGVARWEVLEMAAVSSAAVRFEEELQELVDEIQPDPLVWPAHSNRTARLRTVVRGEYICFPIIPLSALAEALRSTRGATRSEQCWSLCTTLCDRRFFGSKDQETTVAVDIHPLGPGDGAYLVYDLSTYKVELPLHTNDGSILLRLRGSTVDPSAIRDWCHYLERFLLASLERLDHDEGDWEGEASLASFAPFAPLSDP